MTDDLVRNPDDAGAGDLVLNLEGMVEALAGTNYKMSVPTLRALIRQAGQEDDTHPFVAEWGTNGRGYKLSHSKLIAYMDATRRAAEEADALRRQQVAQVQMTLAGVDDPAPSETFIPADERRKFFAAELVASQARRLRRELVEADVVEAADMRRMKVISVFLQQLPDYLARKVTLPPSVMAEVSAAVDAFQETLARTLMETNVLAPDALDRIQRAIREAGLENVFTGGAGADVSADSAAALRLPG